MVSKLEITEGVYVKSGGDVAGNQLMNAHTITRVRFVDLIKTELPKQLEGSDKLLGKEVKVSPP